MRIFDCLLYRKMRGSYICCRPSYAITHMDINVTSAMSITRWGRPQAVVPTHYRRYRAISPANHVPEATQPLLPPPQPWFT